MHRPLHQLAVRGLLAAICAAALTACGSSGNSGNAAQSKADLGLRFSRCMRSHGVPNFPDPGAGGGVGIQINANSGINPRSPAFQSAQKTCSRLLPGGGPGGHPSEARRLEILRLARCMRQHGLPSFPDPTSSPPSGGPGGGPGNGIGLAFGSPGAFLAVPQTIVQSPAFRSAAAACGFPGAKGVPGAKSVRVFP